MSMTLPHSPYAMGAAVLAVLALTGCVNPTIRNSKAFRAGHFAGYLDGRREGRDLCKP